MLGSAPLAGGTDGRRAEQASVRSAPVTVVPV